jgi:uncharacterized protein (DUF2235 family)
MNQGSTDLGRLNMAKRIVVLSDGTGNAASSVWRTNVWRVFELLDLTGADQVAKYDDGVGSSSFKPLALLGGAFGWGLKRNVIDLYKFICRNYEPGVRIYAFGFSRGAFAVRILIGLILREGLVPYRSEGDLHARARDAYRSFRRERFHSILHVESLFRKLRDAFFWVLNRITRRTPYNRDDNRVVPSIEFMGLWDTVAAYGLPIEDMTRGVSQWIWPLYLPERSLSSQVKRACHALALDDERTTFHPVLWTEEGEQQAAPDANGQRWLKDERISQVWFAGVHSNVGGGCPDDALAYLPLYWIMEEAKRCGLVFKISPPADPDAFRRVISACDRDGRQYDSRAGLGGYYRYGPRKIANFCNARISGADAVQMLLPKIHESALARIRGDCNAYAPIGLPETYAVAMMDGRILEGDKNPFETRSEAKARAIDQEKIWNFVWLRRIVYFATLAASFHLAAFWLFHDRDPEYEYSSPFRLISEFIRLMESFLPRQVVHWWTDWYAANPGWFVVGVLALAFLIWLGSKLGSHITDSMRLMWKARASESAIKESRWHWATFRFRTNPIYEWVVFGLTKRYALPFLSAALLLWFGIMGTSHLFANIVDSAGAFCGDSDKKDTIALETAGAQSKPITFKTDALCHPTKVLVERGVRYSVIVKVSPEQPWANDDFQTSPSGFRTASLPGFDRLLMAATLPQRRVIFRRWFSLLARIGATGVAETFLDPELVSGTQNTYQGVIRSAERSGELFLYVNESVVPLPWISDIFYWNNRGSAEVVIKRLN